MSKIAIEEYGIGGAEAAERLGVAPSLAASPRTVIRGETLTGCNEAVSGCNGSVRVNLSVPRRVDDLLCALAQRTGLSKTAFVMQALTWYQPRLETLARELGMVSPVQLVNARSCEIDEAKVQSNTSERLAERISEPARLPGESRAEWRQRKREHAKAVSRASR